ncbi:adenosine deaminase [Glaciecola petra]|uniref:Adenine deaminase n=1 Tax=Glaciecola petra TaxID=3075602 RepID=A0ABU2ZV18_9ALTE|nr:adenosine deaminase [Aestuariibacter sp. P117]MDT0596489.1 adenosine deaminase [Aestuariibacter sp. P117]
MSKNRLVEFANKLPKAELHIHIEGSLEPALMWRLAQKHNITLPFESVEAIEHAYQFEDLQSFLDLYYQGADVLRDEDDFYTLMWSYLCKCHEQKVVHTEIMFDPQTHTARGIDFSIFMEGFKKAIAQAKQEFGMSVYLILSFLRHLSEQSAFDALYQAKPYYEMIKAVGLDSSELGNPPEKFEKVFAEAKSLGFKRVAHAGEEGPPSYIWGAIELLDVHRIDHGVRSSEDLALIEYLRKHEIPLTVCPLSNVKLCVVGSMQEHNILSLLSQGLLVTVNADDPSYFGGYLNENYAAIIENLDISERQVKQLIVNGFRASFLPDAAKQQWIADIENKSILD